MVRRDPSAKRYIADYSDKLNLARTIVISTAGTRVEMEGQRWLAPRSPTGSTSTITATPMYAAVRLSPYTDDKRMQA
jgi:hypothetical protein